MLAVQQERKEECEYLVKIVDEIPDDRAPETIKETITYHTCRLADLDCYPYYKSLQSVHEDLVWLLGVLQIAYGLTPWEVIEYSNKREEAGAFQPGPEKEPIRKTLDEHHERMFG